MDEELLNLLLQRILQVLAVGCVFAAVFFLTWQKSWAQKIDGFLNKWVSTDKLSERLNVKVYIDSQFLKLRKLLGLIAFILALILVYLSFRY